MGALDSQAQLMLARAANQPGSSVPHTVVVLPSYTVGTTLLAHYGRRIPALEHRQLLTMLMLPRIPKLEMIFVTAQLPSERVLEYYLSFVPEHRRDDTRARLHLLEVPDPTPRSITAKLLDRPDLMARIWTMARGRLAFIEPWNVTQMEMDVAQRLGLPLNGTPPSLWPLGFKSNGRRPMREAGVPLPAGREDVRGVTGSCRQRKQSGGNVPARRGSSSIWTTAARASAIACFGSRNPPPQLCCRQRSSPWSPGISPSSRPEPSSRSSSPVTSSPAQAYRPTSRQAAT
jgi:hypothetical protein